MNIILLLSDDDSRVHLDEIPGVEGSDYINASWINVIRNYSAYSLVLMHRDTSIQMPTLLHKVYTLAVICMPYERMNYLLSHRTQRNDY